MRWEWPLALAAPRIGTNGRYSALLTPELPFRFREEFRTPVGVRKSPKNEPAGRQASYGDLISGAASGR
jgi:hypothetical protein